MTLPAISAEEVASLRLDLHATMPDTCVIERDAGGTPDPYGGQPDAEWYDHLTVRCAYWQGGGRTRREVTETALEDHGIALPFGTDVRPTDRVREVRGPDGALRTQRPLRIDHVAEREAVLELTLTEVGW